MVPATVSGSVVEYLYIFSQGVEDLLGHCQRSGEVPLTRFIYHILSRVVPVEVTDGFLNFENIECFSRENECTGYACLDSSAIKSYLKP